MLKRLVKRIKGGDDDQSTAQDRRPSAFDSYNIAGLSKPTQSHHKVERYGNMVESYLAQLQHAPLLRMNIAIDIWPQHCSGARAMQHVAPLSKLLKRGEDSNASSSYSFDEFVWTFEEKMSKVPQGNMKMEHGKLGYFSNTGEWAKVWDQDSFAFAINKLYLNRGITGVFTFIFQPEHDDQRAERLENEALSLEVSKNVQTKRATGGVFGEAFKSLLLDEFVSAQAARRRASEPSVSRKVTSAPVPANDEPIVFHSFPPKHLKLDHAEDGKEDTTDNTGTAMSLPVSPRTIKISRNSDPGPPADLTKVPTTQTIKSTKRASFLKSVSRRFVKGAVGKTVETKEEERERLRGSYQVFKTAHYLRSGKEEDEQLPETGETTQDGGEAADEPSRLEEDEVPVDITNEDRIVIQLQKLQNLGVLTQLKDLRDTTEPIYRWRQCCEMFNIGENNTGLDERVNIAGLNTPLYQYQAFGVYWQMVNSREHGGGFLADDMGLGKTLSFLAYIVVERQLSVLHREVTKARAAGTNQHLQLGQPGRCPKPQRPGWISCPCYSTSPTATMALQPGLRMACVPQALVGQWWVQWKSHIDTTDKVLALKIVVDHPAIFNLPSVSIEDRLSSSERPQNLTRMQVKKVPKEKKDDVPEDYHDGTLLLTTKENYPKLAKKFIYLGQVHKHAGTWEVGHRSTVIFGIAMIDESHEDSTKNHGRGKVLAELPTTNSAVKPFVWGYSGTPFSQNPRGIEGVLWAIEKHQVALLCKKLDDICKAYSQQVKSENRDDAAVAKILAEYTLFLEKFMIRRTAETKWFGHPLMELKPHIHTDVELEPNERFSKNIASFETQFQYEKDKLLEDFQTRWEEYPELRRSDVKPTKLGFNVMARKMWRSRMLATVPYLLYRTTVEKDRLNLTEEELKDYRLPKAEEGSPYRKYLKSTVENSPKCLWLYDFIIRLNEQRDVAGNEHKLVIMTAFPQVALVLKLFIQRYFPEDKERVGVIAGPMKASEKLDILNAFDGKSKRDVRFLIGITRVIGVGLQLQRACHVVLMEPDYEFVRELQAYGRVHRIGQKNPVSKSYRLIDSSSQIEHDILKRQSDRKEFAGKEVSEEETWAVGQEGDVSV